MNTSIGYVLVSKTVHVRQNACGAPGCGDLDPKYHSYPVYCYPPPNNLRCHASCVHDPKLLAQHPECQEYRRACDAWHAAHHHEESTGGTRLGPLHYFGDCNTLLKRGPRRSDARIVTLDAATAETLGLPVCKECRKKMAPFEEQMIGSVTRCITSA